MSTGVVLGSVDFKIKANNIENALKAFKEYFANTKRFDVDAIEDLSEAFSELWFNAYYDDGGNIVNIDTVDNEIVRDSEKLFYAIEKYVEPDSHVEIHTDNQEHFLYTFKNSKCILIKGEVIYPEKNQLSYERANTLVNEFVEHECETKGSKAAAENLLRKGLTDEELIRVFDFDEDVVKAVKELI